MKWNIEDPYIEVTSLCNLKCIYCYNSSSLNTKKQLNISELEKCLSYFNEIGIKEISISGGEPLLYPDLLELLELCSFYEMDVFLVTNGTLLNSDLVSNIKQYVKFYQLSLDGNRETNDTLRGLGSYDKAIKGILCLCEAGLSKNVRLRMTISKKNIDSINHVIQLGLDLGLEAVHFSVVRNQGRACKEFDKELMLNDELLYLAYHKVNNLRKKYKSKIDISRLDIYGGNCTLTSNVPVFNTRIDNEGRVFLCHGFLSEEHSVGNIRQHDLKDIYSSENINKHLKRIRNSRKNEICTNCFWYKIYCNGGCPAQAYYYSGDINGIDGLCNIRKKLWIEQLKKSNT